MRVALIGTRGVPAHYGGFETAVEEVGKRLVQMGHEVVVFCRPMKGVEQQDSYLGMELVHLPAVRVSALETLSHTALSVFHKALVGVDAAIVFNCANAPLLPILHARRIPVATHVDGLEWKRAKWEGTGQEYYRLAEGLAVRWSNGLIADAQGIADYYESEFQAPTRLIAYGAPVITEVGTDRIEHLGLTPGEYHLVVARFEPENHVLEIVQGYVESNSELPLVVVGSAPYSHDYILSIRAAADDRVRLLGSMWDQAQLDQLYAHCLTYLHGHSVGGTNPSLLRAGGAGAYVVAWDVNFNREVVEDHGRYVSSPAEVTEAIEWAEANRETVLAQGAALRDDISRYNWDVVAEQYAQLAEDLANNAVGYGKHSGKRVHESSFIAGGGKFAAHVAMMAPGLVRQMILPSKPPKPGNRE